MKAMMMLVMAAVSIVGAATGVADPGSTIPGDGTFLVGSDIAPGTYFSPGNTNGVACIWHRLSSLDGNGDIDAGQSAGQQYVEIKSSDKAFRTMGCQTWVKR